VRTAVSTSHKVILKSFERIKTPYLAAMAPAGASHLNLGMAVLCAAGEYCFCRVGAARCAPLHAASLLRMRCPSLLLALLFSSPGFVPHNPTPHQLPGGVMGAVKKGSKASVGSLSRASRVACGGGSLHIRPSISRLSVGAGSGATRLTTTLHSHPNQQLIAGLAFGGLYGTR